MSALIFEQITLQTKLNIYQRLLGDNLNDSQQPKIFQSLLKKNNVISSACVSLYGCANENIYACVYVTVYVGYRYLGFISLSTKSSSGIPTSGSSSSNVGGD